jgi:cytochrome c oxidase subunit 3
VSVDNPAFTPATVGGSTAAPVDAHDAHDSHGDRPIYLAHHFDDEEQQRETVNLGMWAFLATEAMMFGGLFFSYTLYRYAFFHEYRAASHLLNFKAGFLNTLVLLASSYTMARSVHAAQLREKKPMIKWLLGTIVLGVIFIGIKAFEWTTDYHEGLVPALNWHPEGLAASINPHHMEMFFVLYFCMTGLHAIHMIAGLGVVGWMTYLGTKDFFTEGNDQPIELVGLYWHFVDIVWVFLFPLLYLVGGVNWGGHH